MVSGARRGKKTTARGRLDANIAISSVVSNIRFAGIEDAHIWRHAQFYAAAAVPIGQPPRGLSIAPSVPRSGQRKARISALSSFSLKYLGTYPIPGRTVGESVGGIFEMDSSDWSNGIRYQTFDTRPDTEFNA